MWCDVMWCLLFCEAYSKQTRQALLIAFGISIYFIRTFPFIFLWSDFIFRLLSIKRRETTIVMTMKDTTRAISVMNEIIECVRVFVTPIHSILYTQYAHHPPQKCGPIMMLVKARIIGKATKNYNFIPFKNIKSWCFFPVYMLFNRVCSLNTNKLHYHLLCTNISFDLVTRLHLSVFFCVCANALHLNKWARYSIYFVSVHYLAVSHNV